MLLLAGCGAGGDSGEALTSGVVMEDDGKNGTVLDQPYVVPDVTLTATDGSPYTLAEDADRPLTLVFFGYTNCPDICQLVMSNIASALTRLEPEQRKQVQVVFVTTDPARDDPETLRTYLDRFDPGFEGLTGDLGRIKRLARPLGIAIAKGAKLPSGGYEVTHGAAIIGVNSKGRVPILWTQGTSSAQLAEDITELLSTDSLGS